MLIPYFTANLLHYFYNLKTRCDQKRTSESDCTPQKTHIVKKIHVCIKYNQIHFRKIEIRQLSVISSENNISMSVIFTVTSVYFMVKAIKLCMVWQFFMVIIWYSINLTGVEKIYWTLYLRSDDNIFYTQPLTSFLREFPLPWEILLFLF